MNYQTFRKMEEHAEEMGVPISQALGARIRYLVEYVGAISEVLINTDTEEVLALDMVINSIDEIDYLKRKLLAMKKGPFAADEVTDVMVEIAREYPVGHLIEFVRGKATCVKHDDTNPSMFYASRSKRAYCPVCAESWDAIGILMQRDGKTFMEAVKWLNHN